MRILCVSAPLPGHLDWGGYLGTAAELQRRGHAVVWASGAAVRTQVEAAGVPFEPLTVTGWRWPPPPPLPRNAGGDPQSYRRLRQLRSLDQWLDVARIIEAVGELREVVGSFRPDLVLTEMFIGAAAIAAEIEAIPLIVAGWPAPVEVDTPSPQVATDPLVIVGRRRLAELFAHFSIAGHNWTAHGPPALCAPKLHVSYWSDSWYAGAPVGTQTVHVGGRASPAKTPPPDFPDPDHKPWVFITLGTTFNQDPAFFVAAGRAADDVGMTPIIALGAGETARLAAAVAEHLPSSPQLATTVDFPTILPYCRASIHHGGAGTTHAIVIHGVPQIVVPHAADQLRQAQGVARSGCGYFIPPDRATRTNLANALLSLSAPGTRFRSRAQALQAEFAALGGVERAAAAIETIVR